MMKIKHKKDKSIKEIKRNRIGKNDDAETLIKKLEGRVNQPSVVSNGMTTTELNIELEMIEILNFFSTQSQTKFKI